MRQSGGERWSVGLMLGLALGLTGCQTHPTPLYLSPLEQARDYGYADVALGQDRYSVTYVAPTRLTYKYPQSRDRDVAEARAVILDFAVWRAAQIAQGQGFSGFHVDDRLASVETYLDPGDSGSPFGHPPFFDNIPSAYLQARATVDITLVEVPGPGDYDTVEAIEHFRRLYPGADAVVPPPAKAALAGKPRFGGVSDAAVAVEENGRLAQ